MMLYPRNQSQLITETASVITITEGLVQLAGTGAITVTLPDPVAGADDGKILAIVATTAQAHKVNNTTGFNGGGASVDYANFGGAVGDSILLTASNGAWLTLGTPRNVTIAGS